jgi:hypothetical protein
MKIKKKNTKGDLFGELTSLVRAVEDLIVEDGEIEGQAQPDRVGWLHLTLADIKCVLNIFYNLK